jgi:probable F420-dependent oxidoreductase
VATTVAAEATSTLNVGTVVLNNDLRNPVVLAKEIATLGLAAEGRVEVGFGAGWLPSDYAQTGIEFDAAGVRVERLAESLAVMKALWTTGEAASAGPHYALKGARCEPRPVASPRVIVGGGSRRVLSVAARHADIVGVNTSLAAGLNAGDLVAQASADHYDRCLGWIRDAAPDRIDSIELQLMAFATKVVGSSRAAARTATMLGLPGEEALELPIVLIGAVEELCDRLQEYRKRWGFSNIVVSGDAMESFAPVVARLAGT